MTFTNEQLEAAAKLLQEEELTGPGRDERLAEVKAVADTESIVSASTELAAKVLAIGLASFINGAEPEELLKEASKTVSAAFVTGILIGTKLYETVATEAVAA